MTPKEKIRLMALAKSWLKNSRRLENESHRRWKSLEPMIDDEPIYMVYKLQGKASGFALAALELEKLIIQLASQVPRRGTGANAKARRGGVRNRVSRGHHTR